MCQGLAQGASAKAYGQFRPADILSNVSALFTALREAQSKIHIGVALGVQENLRADALRVLLPCVGRSLRARPACQLCACVLDGVIVMVATCTWDGRNKCVTSVRPRRVAGVSLESSPIALLKMV